MTISIDDITVVILAGGQGRRMGGEDKGLLGFGGRPLIELQIELLRQQIERDVVEARAYFGLSSAS